MNQIYLSDTTYIYIKMEVHLQLFCCFTNKVHILRTLLILNSLTHIQGVLNSKFCNDTLLCSSDKPLLQNSLQASRYCCQFQNYLKNGKLLISLVQQVPNILVDTEIE
jgi:hypothetical protein